MDPVIIHNLIIREQRKCSIVIVLPAHNSCTNANYQSFNMYVSPLSQTAEKSIMFQSAIHELVCTAQVTRIKGKDSDLPRSQYM